MADQIQMGAYRLSALTYNGATPDIGAAVKSGRLAMLYVEAKVVQQASFRLSALATTTRKPDHVLAAAAGRVGLLYMEGPVLKQAAFRMNAIATSRRNPDFALAASAGRLAFLIRPPTMFASAGRLAFLIDQAEMGPAAFVPQTFMKVFQAADWPTVSDTISTTRVLNAVEQVVQALPQAPQPLSNTVVPSVTQKVLQQAPYAFSASFTRVSGNVMLALQSDLHEYIPVSMDYVLSMAQQTLQETPMSIWQSPHYALQVAQWELYSTPMGFLPRSTSTAYHASLKVLQADEMGYLPWSDTSVGQVVLKALQHYVSPLPDQGTDEVRQNVLLALQHTEGETGLIGPVAVRQNTMLALQEREDVMPISPVRVASAVSVALVQEFYPPPESIGKTTAVQSVMQVVTDADGYQNPEIITSTTRTSQVVTKALQESDPMPMWVSPAIVPQAHVEWLQAANYPKPGDMIPPVNAALVSQVWIKTVQEVIEPMPQSDTRALQMAQLTSQYLFYTPASDLAEKGVFIGQLAEAVARNVTYPDPAEPISPAFVNQITVITAYTDDTFPDPTKQAKPGEVFQVSEIYASGVAYPDPTVSQVWAEVTQTFVQKSVSDTFPDPAVPVSSVTLTQISIQDAISADYPDPVALVSPAVVSQVVGQVSQVSSFPDPNKPASSLTVDQALQMVAIPDVTLYGVPDYAIKHRPVITISIVYIQAP